MPQNGIRILFLFLVNTNSQYKLKIINNSGKKIKYEIEILISTKKIINKARHTKKCLLEINNLFETKIVLDLQYP